MSTRSLHSGIRARLLSAYLISTVLVTGGGVISVMGLHKALAYYQYGVSSMEDNAKAVLHIQSRFKIQVQEWKNVLLRGGDAKKLEKYWSSFQAREAEVAGLTAELVASLPDDSDAKRKVELFEASHRTLAKEYREGLKAFNEAHADPKAGDAAVAGIDRAPTKLLDDAEEAIEELTDQTRALANEEARLGIVSGAVVLLIALGCGIGTFREPPFRRNCPVFKDLRINVVIASF